MGISLVRLHTEKIRPPRALWVPFDLGRPLGAPNDAAFQTRVVRAALDLLERTDGPILEDFPDDAPDVRGEDEEGWVCPISLPALEAAEDQDSALLEEIETLRSWYDLAVERRGRTAVGTSGLPVDEIARYLSAWARGETPANPSKDPTLRGDNVTMIRLVCDDLKAYYSEAATAQPGRGDTTPNSAEISQWFWSQTQAANMLLKLKATLSQSEDKMIATVGQLLIVPYTQSHLMAVAGDLKDNIG